MIALLLLCLQTSSALGSLNVYDKPMTACGSDHAAGCTYAAYDAGAHQVCVTKLPKGFSSVTGQGPWSDQFTGQPWCICIWAYSNYILQNKDLALKCESIPAKVLEEHYSLDKFKQCGKMSSTTGCGPEDIRRSIQSLCQQCDRQAVDQTSRAALKNKCDTILSAAPAAPMSRLFAQDGSVGKAMSQTHSGSAVSAFVPALAFPSLLLAAALAATAAYRAFGARNRATQLLLDSEDPARSAEAVE